MTATALRPERFGGRAMPIHAWTRVSAGTCQDFHHDWISTIKRALNSGVLPAGYYAMSEQLAGGLGPDVLTLESVHPRTGRGEGNGPAPAGPATPSGPTGMSLATAPPKVRFLAGTGSGQDCRKGKGGTHPPRRRGGGHAHVQDVLHVNHA